MPVLWEEVSEPDARTDEQKSVLQELNGIQMSNWEGLRYEDRNSPKVSMAVAALAKELKLKLS